MRVLWGGWCIGFGARIVCGVEQEVVGHEKELSELAALFKVPDMSVVFIEILLMVFVGFAAGYITATMLIKSGVYIECTGEYEDPVEMEMDSLEEDPPAQFGFRLSSGSPGGSPDPPRTPNLYGEQDVVCTTTHTRRRGTYQDRD